MTATHYQRPGQVAEMLGWTEKTLRTYRVRGGCPPPVREESVLIPVKTRKKTDDGARP